MLIKELLKLNEAKTKAMTADPVELTVYSDSSDFDEAYATASDAAKLALEIMKSPAMKEWMKATSSNFSDFNEGKYDNIVNDLKVISDDMDSLYDHLGEVGE